MLAAHAVFALNRQFYKRPWLPAVDMSAFAERGPTLVKPSDAELGPSTRNNSVSVKHKRWFKL
jgi:hypothetical protein